MAAVEITAHRTIEEAVTIGVAEIGEAVMTEEVVTTGVAEIGEAVMTEEAVTIGVAEIDVAVMTETEVALAIEETTEGQTKKPIPEMIGFVENVVIRISHSEPNATAAAPRREEERAPPSNGKVMTAGREIEERHHNLGLEIGNALSVANLISQGETIVSDVAVPSESVDPKEEVIIAN